MEQRMLLAFGLMLIVLLGSNWLLPQKPEPAAKKDAPAATPAKPEAEAASKQEPAEKPETPSKPAEAMTAAGEETVTVETGLFRVTFRNRGAVVTSWVLKKFTDSKGEPLDLVNPKLPASAGFPFSYSFHTGQSADLLNQALHSVEKSADGRTVSFRYSNGTWVGAKTFAFKEDSYLLDVTSEVTVAGKPKPHLLAWRAGFGDPTVIGAAAAQHNVYYDLNDKKLYQKYAKDASETMQSNRGTFDFAGINDTYFAAVALPKAGSPLELHTFSDKAPNMVDGKEEAFTGMAIGGDGRNAFEFFAGPKDIDLLATISPRLTQLIDWGMFRIFAETIFKALHWLHDQYVKNWGWSIVIFTFFINMALLPLKLSSMKSMKKMGALKPHIDEINKKYKGVGFNDPKRQQQQEEVMALYKKHGVNPLNLGCMPMVIQIPFFFALYKVLSVSIELRGADWLWVSDLSRPENFLGDFRILPLGMVVTQILMQRITPQSAGMDPAQQKMMTYMMPVMFLFFLYGMSSGLMLYWLTSNLVGIGQQWFFNRFFPTEAPVPPVPAVSPGKKPRK